MTNKDAYIEHLENTIKDLQNQVRNLTEMVMLLRKEKFGSSSEKTPKQIEGQLSLFNEAEFEADDSVPEPIKKEVRGYTRVHAKTKREELIKDLPVREILCESAPEDQICPSCYSSLRPLGKETVREELEYIPAKLQIVRYVRMAYECPKCKHTDHPYIQKALTPTSLLNHSLASPSSVANVMYQKYANSVPLYRQEKDWEQLGITLSRATMANWVIRCSQDYLIPMVEHLRRKFIEAIPAKKGKDTSLTSAEIGRDYCNQLFKIEDSLKDLSPNERYRKRLELEKPVLEAFWCWLEKLNCLKGSALGKTVIYAKNQKPYMENYLLDGRLSVSNNAAENAIRPFTVGRKNWLFADTPKGAAASAAVYSLIETAKANGLNVYTYLEYLLLYMPDVDWRNDPTQLDFLMPWSEAVQVECKR